MKVAVVTGAASGIGAATVASLAAEGFTVAAVDLAACPAPPGGGISVRADVSAEADVASAIAGTVAAFGRIDVLVNNAGITGSPEAARCHETPVAEFDRVIAVNVRGPFLCARAVLPVMLAQRSGHVITIASVAGLVAFPGRCAYTTSKGAAVQLTRSLAADYAASGIRANAICPGFARTPMTAWRLDQPALRAEVERRIPLGRVAEPEEIAEAVAVLASGRLGYLTGHALALDGGWTAI